MQIELHSQMVKELSSKLARLLKIGDKEIKMIIKASGLHDIGQLNIPQEILKKPSALTKKEYDVVKLHPLISSELVKNISEYEEVGLIVKHHHERYDGKGYPNKLKGKEIPLGSRIIGISDAFVAMISERPYRKKMTIQEAINELINNKGTQFDPELVDLFINIVSEQAS